MCVCVCVCVFVMKVVLYSPLTRMISMVPGQKVTNTQCSDYNLVQLNVFIDYQTHFLTKLLILVKI